MNYLTVELGFYFSAAYMLFLAFVVGSVLWTLARRRMRYLSAQRYERERKERERQEMVRFFVGVARDRSYREPVS